MEIDADSAFILLQKLARKEVDQNRKNLERELAVWKSKNAKLSQRIGRYRATIRYLKSKDGFHEQVKKQLEEAMRVPEESSAGKSLRAAHEKMLKENDNLIGAAVGALTPQGMLDKASFEASKRQRARELEQAAAQGLNPMLDKYGSRAE